MHNQPFFCLLANRFSVKKRLIRFLGILTLSTILLNSFSQFTYTLDKTTRFEKLGVNEGLSTDFSKCIHQDKYGFIWIGTQRGLNLYDGYQMESFMANPNDTNAITNDFILTIYEEEDGTMWFGTNKGISKYDRTHHTFKNFLPEPHDVNNLQNVVNQLVIDGKFLWISTYSGLLRFNKETETFISFGEDTLNPTNGIKGNGSNYLYKDGEGKLWVGSGKNSKGKYLLSRYDKDSNTFTHFKNNPDDRESFAGNSINSMIEDQQGTIWIATIGGGLIEMIDREKGKFRQYRHVDSDENTVISNNLYCVFEDSHANIWTGGYNGFSKFKKETGEFINYPIPNQKNNSEIATTIRNIIEDPKGELWMGAYEGLFRFDPLQKTLIQYSNDPDNDNSLSDNGVNQIIIDQSGQIWVSTWNRGVCIINQFSNTFMRIQKKPNVKSSLLGNHVTSIFANSNGNYWIGTFKNGLNRTKIIHGKVDEKFEHFISDINDPNGITSDIIMDIYEDKNKFMWFATYKGLNKYDPKRHKFTSYQNDPKDNSSISSNGVLSIYEDSRGIFWVGTYSGLNIMDTKTGKFIRIMPDANDTNSTINNYFRVIFEDSQGELWFGGKYLERLNRKDSSFIHYIAVSNNADRNISEVWDIEEDDSGNLWFATLRGGLLHWNRKSQLFDAITVEEGLPSNYIVEVDIDNTGDIWAGSNRGLSRIKKRTHKVRNYDVADGLVSMEISHRSGFKDKEGWLYFGTKYGIMYFHPESLKENTLIPPVYITAMNISGRQKFFEKPVYEMSRVELNHNENDLSFDFVALNYVNSQKNQYAYMLEGYDEDWNYVGNRRTAYCTNLNPGTYTFKVKGSNNDGYWNEEGASLVVMINPPYWKTWWAYVLYVLFFFGLLYLLRRYELNRLHLKQNLEIKQVETDKILELDAEKNKFFSNISHEFRTPLTLILGPLDRIIAKLKNKEQVDEINLVRRNARRLQTLINQLLSLSKLESGKMKLKAGPENIVQLTTLFLDSFHSLAEDRGIKTEFESDEEEFIVYVDKLKFEKIVNNLLSNAFKFTERGGKIKVSISSSNEVERGGVIVKCSDTGIGIRKERLQYVFDRFYQVDEQQQKSNLGTGIGLALTKELVELHHGEIKVDSEFGIGSTFTLFFPSGKDHLTEDEIVQAGEAMGEMDGEMTSEYEFFVQDAVSKPETTEIEIPADSELPLLLIVEDNADMRTYIKSYLINSYHVLEASNGKVGAEMAIRYLPDLIVSDLMMPELDGNEMTALLKNDERTSHIPIILLTAKASSTTKLEGLESGADDFLTKPFDAEELLIRIRNLVEQRKKLRELLSQHIGDVKQTRIIKESSGKALSKVDEQFLEKVQHYIDEQMSNPDFSVEMLALALAMSRSQLHRKLKSLTAITATDFIRDIRLRKAAELLKEGELNITQITYEIGISSLSYFSRAFKEKYGVSPSEYASQ